MATEKTEFELLNPREPIFRYDPQILDVECQDLMAAVLSSDFVFGQSPLLCIPPEFESIETYFF